MQTRNGVELIVAGNEILIGDVLDTNSNWICKRITGIGGHVSRVVTVRDDVSAIANEIASALARVETIFTLGGLGPTEDDKTLQAVAIASNRPLMLNDVALNLVSQKYREFLAAGSVDDSSMTPSRQKMANLPKGATPLNNSVGAAPGVLLPLEKATVISLPGVPDEMRSIFENSLQPFLKQRFGAGGFVEVMLIANCKDESFLAPILKELSIKNPEVYIKSRPKRFGPDVKIRLTISASGEDVSTVESMIKKASSDLTMALSRKGVSVETVESQV